MRQKTIDVLITIFKVVIGALCFAPGLFGISYITLQLLLIVRFLCNIHTVLKYVRDVLAQDSERSVLSELINGAFTTNAICSIIEFLI